jgi:hypothetical protein
VNQVLQAAIDFLEAGVSVVPASMDGSNSPIGSGKNIKLKNHQKKNSRLVFK